MEAFSMHLLSNSVLIGVKSKHGSHIRNDVLAVNRGMVVKGKCLVISGLMSRILEQQSVALFSRHVKLGPTE